MTRFWHKKRFKFAGQRGFTLIELLIVVAIIGILAAIAIPLFASVLAKARIARAQSDARSLVTAVTMWSAHMGYPPTDMTDLTAVATNDLGQEAGPFMAQMPCLPSTNWTGDAGNAGPQCVSVEGFGYSLDSVTGAFTVFAEGDNATVAVP